MEENKKKSISKFEMDDIKKVFKTVKISDVLKINNMFKTTQSSEGKNLERKTIE